jgi:uncharacterized protein (DUF952 family)
MNSSPSIFVYRVMKLDEWSVFKKNKEFFGNSFDKKSGFIHLSTKKQLNKTIDLYFNNNTKLIILKFNVKKFGKDLKWEKSRDGQFFPHLYGLLNYDDILTYESYDE